MVEIQHPRFGSVEATDIDYESPDEEWREYELEDGTTLKVKTIVKKVFRIEDQYNDLGEPVYEISTENLVRSTNVPEEIMGDPNERVPPEIPDEIREQLEAIPEDIEIDMSDINEDEES